MHTLTPTLDWIPKTPCFLACRVLSARFSARDAALPGGEECVEGLGRKIRMYRKSLQRSLAVLRRKLCLIIDLYEQIDTGLPLSDVGIIH